MKVKIDRNTYAFLLEHILESNKEILSNLRITEYERFVLINLNDDIADKIRNTALDMIELYGFDINYELTDKGKILEVIIDTFCC